MVGKRELPANQPTYTWIHRCAHTEVQIVSIIHIILYAKIRGIRTTLNYFSVCQDVSVVVRVLAVDGRRGLHGSSLDTGDVGDTVHRLKSFYFH